MIVVLVVPLILLLFYYSRKRKVVQVYPESCVSSTHIEPVDREWQWNETEPLPIRPFVNKRNFNVSLGIRNISKTPHEWLLIENTYQEQTRLRKHYTQNYPDKTTLAYDNDITTKAVKEFYDITLAFLTARYPTVFRIKSETVVNTITNEEYPISSTNQTSEQLVLYLAYLIEEDFLILIKDNPKDPEEEYILRATATGFPAGFDPSHNHNKPISFIHKPVPQYGKRLKNPMGNFFNKLQPKDLWVRHNWSIQTHKSYFSLDSNHARDGEVLTPLKYTEIDFEDGCFLRVERQCFTRLPKSGANVMTVRTYLTPIRNVKKEGLSSDLIHAIDSLPDDLAFYKRRGAWGEAVKEYLRN